MSDLAPEATASDNALTGGFEPEQSAAPAVEQGQAPESAPEAAWTTKYSEGFQSLAEKKGLSGLSEQEAIENIANSYTNLESLKNVSGENLFNISGDIDDETREKVYSALGRPDAPDQYSYEAQETDNQDLVGTFKNTAHELGLTDKQVAGMIPALNEKIVEIAEAHTQELQTKNNEGLGALQKEWGGAWEANKNLAVRAAEHFGITEEMQVAIRDSGQSAGFLKALNQMGGLMAEGAMAGMSPQAGSAAMGVMTPEAAQQEINSKMSDPEFMRRYHSQDHSIRVAAAKEIEPFRKAAVGK